MTHSVILKISAVIAAIFGVALIFVPNELLAMYKAAPMNSPGVYNSMLYGSSLIGFAFMNWAASNEPSIADVRYVLLGNLVGMGVGFLVTIIRQLTNVEAVPAGWVNVAIFFVLASLFAYLYFGKLPKRAGVAALRGG